VIPTIILLGIVLGRWWRTALVVLGLGWPAVLVATGVIDSVGTAVGAAVLALGNAAVGVGAHQASLRLVRGNAPAAP
jgi:hypothetical protein